MSNVRIGMIGESLGNGHPYSWSAILNGYDEEEMDKCGFPSIPDYLKGRCVGERSEIDARVASIYCDDSRRATSIARTSKIEHVAQSLDELIYSSDAIVIARDDVEDRRPLVQRVLDSGVPVFIDKPFEISLSRATKILEERTSEYQISSESSLVHSSFIRESQDSPDSDNPVLRVRASVPKDWQTYGIHAVHPALRLLGPKRGEITNTKSSQARGKTRLVALFSSGQELVAETTGGLTGGFAFELERSSGTQKFSFGDPFDSFYRTLANFVSSIERKSPNLDTDEVIQAVTLIERGLIG